MFNEPTYLSIALRGHFANQEDASKWITEKTSEYSQEGYTLRHMSMYDHYRYDKKGLRIEDSKYISASVTFAKGSDNSENYLD